MQVLNCFVCLICSSADDLFDLDTERFPVDDFSDDEHLWEPVSEVERRGPEMGEQVSDSGEGAGADDVADPLAKLEGIQPSDVFSTAKPPSTDFCVKDYATRKQLKPFMMYMQDLRASLPEHSHSNVLNFAHISFPMVKPAYLVEAAELKLAFKDGGITRNSKALSPLIVQVFKEELYGDRAQKALAQVDSEKRGGYIQGGEDIDAFIDTFDNDCLV